MLTLGDVRSWPGRCADFALGWIPRTFRAALGLSGEQRQTLMSWGLIGGIIALTALKLRSQISIEAHWKAGMEPSIEVKLVDGLFAQLMYDTLLQGALVVGLVAIARGGSMLMTVNRGGATIEFQASGAAAKQLATDTDLSAAADGNKAPDDPAPRVPEEN